MRVVVAKHWFLHSVGSESKAFYCEVEREICESGKRTSTRQDVVVFQVAEGW